MSRSRSYEDDWDIYVANWKAHARLEPTNKGRDDLVYPGDEWGKPEEWRAHAERFLLPYLPEQGVAVEVGPGSGKYSLLMVERASRLACFDVSRRFMEVASVRLAGHVKSGRVSMDLLSLSDCNEITQRLERHGLVGRVDLFFSVDSMQHVELHTLFAYLVAASACLRRGGHLSMTVATCTTDEGFARLVHEAPWYYGGSRAGHQFYFLSRDIVEGVVGRLGFELADYHEARDINFVARKLRDSNVTLAGV